MASTPARIAFLAGALVTGFTIQALVAVRGEAPPVPSPDTATAALSAPPVRRVAPPPDQPPVNYRGTIRGVDSGGDHQAPTVYPQRPLDIVTDDCSRVELFDVDSDSYDAQNHLLTLFWWDPGVKQNRTLTIILSNRSCVHLTPDRTRPDAP